MSIVSQIDADWKSRGKSARSLAFYIQVFAIKLGLSSVDEKTGKMTRLLTDDEIDRCINKALIDAVEGAKQSGNTKAQVFRCPDIGAVVMKMWISPAERQPEMLEVYSLWYSGGRLPPRKESIVTVTAFSDTLKMAKSGAVGRDGSGCVMMAMGSEDIDMLKKIGVIK